MNVQLFLVAAFSTFFCTAVNAYTLRIAYPLWCQVGAAEFGTLHREYLRRLGPIITFPHIVMFFSSAALMRWRPYWLTGPQACLVFVLDAGVVAVSAFAAGPVHSRFERTGVCDEAGLRRLIQISALRTVMMLAASGLLLWRLLEPLTPNRDCMICGDCSSRTPGADSLLSGAACPKPRLTIHSKGSAPVRLHLCAQQNAPGSGPKPRNSRHRHRV